MLNLFGNLSNLKLEELVGDLQTYEIDMFPDTIKPKDRGKKFKSQSKKKKKVSFYESESESESDFDMAMLEKNF